MQQSVHGFKFQIEKLENEVNKASNGFVYYETQLRINPRVMALASILEKWFLWQGLKRSAQSESVMGENFSKEARNKAYNLRIC